MSVLKTVCCTECGYLFDAAKPEVRRMKNKGVARGPYGARLKALREKYDLSQSALADILDVSSSVVSGWEIGRHIPRGENEGKLNILFDIGPDRYREAYNLGRLRPSAAVASSASLGR